MVRLRRGLNIADSRSRCGCFGKWSSGYEIMEQLAYAYATLVEDCERVVDEVGYAEVRVRGLHG
jgi:hypothetical protein